MHHYTNLVRIKAVANAINPLNKKIVFVGGAAVSLYADNISLNVRPTEDVDVIVEVLDYTEFSQFEDKLRQIGFQNDILSGIICRYTIEGITVDILPVKSNATMHANPWHEEGFNNAIEYKLMDANSIFILSPGYFLASKFSAFNDRGNNDGRTSKDFEDVVFILQNRKNIWNELNEADPKVKIYLQKQFQRLFQNPYLREWVECHLDRNLENSASWMLQKMREFISS